MISTQKLAELIVKVVVWVVSLTVAGVAAWLWAGGLIAAMHQDDNIPKDPQAFIQSCQADTIQYSATHTNGHQKLTITCVGK